MSLSIRIDDRCPRCGKPITLAVIDLHPIRNDAATLTVECVGCGHIKTNVLPLRPSARPRRAA